MEHGHACASVPCEASLFHPLMLNTSSEPSRTIDMDLHTASQRRTEPTDGCKRVHPHFHCNPQPASLSVSTHTRFDDRMLHTKP